MAANETFDLTLVAEVPPDPAARWLAMKAHTQLGLGQKIELGQETRFTLEGAGDMPTRPFAFATNFTLMRVRGSGSEETWCRQYEVRTPANMTVARFRLDLKTRRFVYTFAQ